MVYFALANNNNRGKKESQNILLTNSFTAKVADFGLSRFMMQSASVTGMGTIAWCAPELLLQEKQGKAVDVWSFGVILWELCCEQVPYGDMAPGAIVLGIVQKRLHLPRGETLLVGAPDTLTQLIQPCQEFIASERPTFETILGRL